MQKWSLHPNDTCLPNTVNNSDTCQLLSLVIVKGHFANKNVMKSDPPDPKGNALFMTVRRNPRIRIRKSES